MAKSPLAAAITCEQDVRDKLVPVILGGDILGYSYVREFHRVYGITSIHIASADIKVCSSSKFCDYRILEDIDDQQRLVSYLMDLGAQLLDQGKLGILVGTGDWYARIFSEHKPTLEQCFVVPYIDFDLLDDITQKERFYQLCDELGMDYPTTWRIDCATRDERFDAASFSYPLIAKPSNSARYHYAEFPGKKKIFEVEGPEELERIYTNLLASSYDHELIVQDLIPGEDDGLHSVTTFSDDEGNLRVSCMGQVVLQDHAPSAIGNPVVIRNRRVEHVIEQAARFLKRTGYHGFANFDVKYDPRDGSYRFFEVNTRPGRNTFYLSLAGVPFVTLFVEEYVLGHTIPETRADQDFLYACVPPLVVRRTVKDPVLRDEVLAGYASGLAQFPLFYEPDSLAHWFWAEITYNNQIRKFKKYVWDTGGKQADAD